MPWLLLAAAIACIATAGTLAQRELFARGRQVEIRDGEIGRLNDKVEMGERKLEAEEILLRRMRDHMRSAENAR